MAEPTYPIWQQYGANVQLAAQQMTNLLRSAIRVETLESNKKSPYDITGTIKARRATTRHAPTEIDDYTLTRRWVTPNAWRATRWIDRLEDLEALYDPSSALAQSLAAAHAREQMADIMSSAIGAASTGEHGTDTVAFDTAKYQIVHGGVGITLAKVQTALDKLIKSHGATGNDSLWLAWTRDQESAFIQNAEVKSIDYNTQRVLISGGMGGQEFLGFRYIRLDDWTDEAGNTSTILPKASTTRSCVAWVQSGILFAEQEGITVRNDAAAWKNYSKFVWSESVFGTVRTRDTHVVEIQCTES
jgi:hypothetical protein